MFPILPVLLGAALAALAHEAGSGARLPVASLVPWASPLAPWGEACALALEALALALVARLVGRATGRRGVEAFLRAGREEEGRAARFHFRLRVLAWALLLALFAVVLDTGGLSGAARELGPWLVGPAHLGPWLLACGGFWAGLASGERAALGPGTRVPPPSAELRTKARRVIPILLVGYVVERGASALVELDPVREVLELNPRLQALVAAAGTLVLLSSGPLLVRLLFPTAPLPGLTGPLPLPGGALAGYTVRLWRVGSPVATAAVAGIAPGLRTVFVTDELLRLLTPLETAAVLLHELGHSRRGHLAALAVGGASFFLALDGLARAAAAWDVDASTPLLAAAAFAFLGLSLGLALRASRRLEHDADLYAAHHLGAAPIMAALLKTAAANGVEPARAGLRHPSLDARVALLEAAMRDPELGARHQRRTRALLRTIPVVASLLLLVSLQGVDSERRRPERERLLGAARACLALDERARARLYLERAAGAPAGDEPDARALALLALARPDSERALAAVDLARAASLARTPRDEREVARARAALEQR